MESRKPSMSSKSGGRPGRKSTKSQSPSRARNPSLSASSKSPSKRGLDSEKNLEADKAEQHRLFVLSNCTRLNFIFLDKSTKESLIMDKVMTYSDLQREIAKLTPKRSTIFMCQDDDGNIVSSSNFKALPKFVIREIQASTMIPAQYPPVDIKWDFKSYHARPPKWKDVSEERKKRELDRRRQKELDELSSVAEGRRTDVNVLLNSTGGKAAASSDDLWENAVVASTRIA